MNNIIINNENYIVDEKHCKIDIQVNKLNLKINGEVNIYDFNKQDELNLNIDVKENSILNYYMFSNSNFNNKKIIINNYENSKTNFNYSFINEKKCKLIINNNILENNISSNIKVRSVCLNSTIDIESNGSVEKNTSNNEFNEDLRGLNLNQGMVNIKPNMFIDTNDIIANHNATIGNINEDYLFYLNSKGINNEDAKNLIISGFIKSILDEKMNENL